jgi:hypothetical protein
MNKKTIKKDQLYNLDYELAKIILQALKDFKELNAKTSYRHVEESILDEMILGFDSIVNEGECTKYDKTVYGAQQRALKLFAENFNRLWI